MSHQKMGILGDFPQFCGFTTPVPSKMGILGVFPSFMGSPLCPAQKREFQGFSSIWGFFSPILGGHSFLPSPLKWEFWDFFFPIFGGVTTSWVPQFGGQNLLPPPLQKKGIWVFFPNFWGATTHCPPPLLSPPCPLLSHPGGAETPPPKSAPTSAPSRPPLTLLCPPPQNLGGPGACDPPKLGLGGSQCL